MLLPCNAQAAGAIQAYGMHAVVANLLPTRTTRVLLITPPAPKAADAADAEQPGSGSGSGGASQPAERPPPQPAAAEEAAKDCPQPPWRARLSAGSVPHSGSASSLRDLGAGAAAKVRSVSLCRGHF